MPNKEITLESLPKELNEIFNDFVSQSFEVRQQALQAGAEVFKAAIEDATPKDTGEMSRSWKIKKYKDRRYVGNTRVAIGKAHRKTKDGSKGEAREGVPLSNVLEYGEKSKHYGFIRQCYDASEPQVFDAIKNKLNNGGQ